jgi:hypothetical protein
MGGIILETERLSLREITEDDLDDLLEIWGDPETMRFFPRTLDSQAMREWIERNQRRYEQYGHGLWAATLWSERKLVGDTQDCNSCHKSCGHRCTALHAIAFPIFIDRISRAHSFSHCHNIQLVPCR